MNNVFLGEPSEYIRNWFIKTFPPWPAYTTLKFVDGTTQTKEITGAATWQNIGVKNSQGSGNNTLNSCQLGNKVTEISSCAFQYCNALSSIDIPNSVTSIGEWTFGGCYSLTSINIPNSVSLIGNFAFNYCSSLTSINIPNSVSSIGYYAFSHCNSLTSINVYPNNTRYDSRDNCNAIIETSSNTLTHGIGNSTIPNSVNSIGINAFYGCYSLTSITIPNSVSSIGSQAFAECESLTSINIPSSVSYIEQYVFLYSSNLQSVVFEGRTMDQIKAMANYPWDIPNTNAIIAGIK